METFLDFDTFIFLLIAMLLAQGSMQDIKYRKVPNTISLLVFVLSLAYASVNYEMSAAGIMFICISTASLALYTFGFIGGADAKIIMALSPLIPFSLLPAAMIWLSIFSFSVSLFYLLKKMYQKRIGNNKSKPCSSVPFFVPLTLCYFFVILSQVI